MTTYFSGSATSHFLAVLEQSIKISPSLQAIFLGDFYIFLRSGPTSKGFFGFSASFRIEKFFHHCVSAFTLLILTSSFRIWQNDKKDVAKSKLCTFFESAFLCSQHVDASV